MNLTRYERETVITFNEADDFANVYTYNRPLIRKLKKLAQILPTVTVETQTEELGVYQIPKKLVGVRIPRQLSEENRRELADRARANLAKKAGTNI